MKIIQISDTHICKEKNNVFFSQISMVNLKKITDDIKKHKDISAVLITGDISQDGTIESYINSLELLGNINPPIYCIPGNHDNIENMCEAFSSSNIRIISDAVEIDGWEFHYINTTIPGEDCGLIDDYNLNLIRKKLSETTNNVVIVTHHHILPVGTQLVDECMVLNTDELLKVLDENKSVKLVMCGHVHGDYKITRGHYCMETSPATCFQWIKETKTPHVIHSIGYKVFTFHSNNYESECIFL
ncbi:metallophosphoesterase family protein [Klebsiella michiganensis]|uniref:metallophosphoesterase family protein n=1 Tax=Klebsiella michiganensis TaxID=1134687 RepID=UPI003F4F9B35